MSLARSTARGAALTIVSSLGARAVGVVGTLVLTRFLAPEVVGEVGVATILVMSFNWLTIWGFGQYVIVKGRGDDAAEVTWHCTVGHLGLGVVGLGAAALFAGRFAPHLDAASAAQYVPGMAAAIGIRRLGSIPEKILMREMRFRPIAATSALGELTYAVVAVALAASGRGGMSVVLANIAQSTLMATILITAAGWRSWLTPTRLSWQRFRDMTRFGLPLAVESIAHNASRYWDNLLISRCFGPGPTGVYNLAYNLADIPATQVGEQIAQVLLPSLSALPPERRPRALERATALLSLIIFPMAVGLALVAEPLVALVLPPKWHEVAPLLVILSVVSVFRPITWVLSTYLEAQAQTSRLMVLEMAKVAILLLGIALLAPLGIEAAAFSVGIAFGFNAIAGIWAIGPGPSVMRLASGFLQPLAACGAMAAAVIATRELVLGDIDSPAVLLTIEITLGAIAYVAAALVICRDTARDFLGLLKDLRRRRAA